MEGVESVLATDSANANNAHVQSAGSWSSRHSEGSLKGRVDVKKGGRGDFDGLLRVVGIARRFHGKQETYDDGDGDEE